MRLFEPAEDVAPDIAEALELLRGIEKYPFDYDKDLAYLQKLASEFPGVDIPGEIKKWEAWLEDNTIKKNWRLGLRNWICHAKIYNKKKYSPPAPHRAFGETGMVERW